MNGPIWLDPINNTDFIYSLIQNFDAVKQQNQQYHSWSHVKNLKVTKFDDINGLLRSIAQEFVVQNIPVTWDLTELFGKLKVGAPKNNMILYLVSYSALPSTTLDTSIASRTKTPKA